MESGRQRRRWPLVAGPNGRVDDGLVHLRALLWVHPRRGPSREGSRADHRFGAPLSAITAVVVGVIASLALFFSVPVLFHGGVFNPWALLVVGLALFVQLSLGWGVLQVIGAAATIGALLAGVAMLSS